MIQEDLPKTRPLLSCKTVTILWNRNKGLFLSLFLFELVNLAGFEMSKWIGFLGLVLLYFLVKSVYDDSYSALSNILVKRFFLILLVLQGLGWFIYIFVKYFSLCYGIYDTGIFAHTVFNISSGRGIYNYILQIPAWVDHFYPNLILLTPLFWIKPTILWLPFLRLLAYLACLPILWAISKFYLQDKKWRYFILILWLINYPLLIVLSSEFQPCNLALPFLILSFYLYLKRYYILFVLNLFFLLGFKENMALAWLSVGAWIFFFEKKKMFGICIAISGIIAGLIIVYILTPYLSGGIANHQLEKFGPLQYIPQKLKFIFLIFLSVGFLPLLNPKTFLFILPAFGISLVSNTPTMFRIVAHYQDLPMAIIFMALILALSTGEKRQSWIFRFHTSFYLKKIPILIALFGIILYNNYYPGRIIKRQWPTLTDLETLAEIRYLKTQIDSRKVLWTTNNLGPYFIEFPFLRLFEPPQGFVHEDNAHYIIHDYALYGQSSELKKIKQIIDNTIYKKLPDFHILHIYESK